MELKLNIYDDNNKVIKTYKAESFNLKTRTIRKLTQVVDLEKVMETKNNTELASQVSKIVVTTFDEVSLILKQMFEGLTDEEIDNTNLNEVVAIVMEVGKDTLNKLFGIKFEKN